MRALVGASGWSGHYGVTRFGMRGLRRCLPCLLKGRVTLPGNAMGCSFKFAPPWHLYPTIKIQANSRIAYLDDFLRLHRGVKS